VLTYSHETGSLSVSVADTCYVTCPKTGLKVILEYLEEGWLGRTQNKVQGVVFKYDAKNDTTTKIKDVSEKDILARIEGNWQDKIYYTLGNKPFNKVSVSLCKTPRAQHNTNVR
jgi:spore coat protein CotH